MKLSEKATDGKTAVAGDLGSTGGGGSDGRAVRHREGRGTSLQFWDAVTKEEEGSGEES